MDKLIKKLDEEKTQKKLIEELDQMIKAYKKKSREKSREKSYETYLETLLKDLKEWRKKFERNKNQLNKFVKEDVPSREGYEKIFKSKINKYEKFVKLISYDSSDTYIYKMLKITSKKSKGMKKSIKITNISKPKAKITADASAGTGDINTSKANESHKRKSKTSEEPTPKRLKSGNWSILAGI